MEQIRQVFRIAESFQSLRNDDSVVLQMFHKGVDELARSFPFVFPGAYLPLIVSSSGRKKMAGSSSRDLETTSANGDLHFFHVVHFVK